MTDWDARFLNLAQHVGQWSKDRTKVGAVIARPDHRIVSLGFNGFAAGMSDDEELYADRPTKLSRVIHAEMNALLFAAQPVVGCTLYTWPMLSCDRCFVHMVQAGIRRFVAPTASAERLEHWGEAFERVRAYATECGVEVVEVAA
jgi:dCMP deaminase